MSVLAHVYNCNIFMYTVVKLNIRVYTDVVIQKRNIQFYTK